MMANCRRTAFAPRADDRGAVDERAGRREDDAHRHERQPETRRQRRERIEQQHGDQRQRPGAARAHVPRRQPRQREQREHQPGALRGHREPGQQRIAARGRRGLTTTRRARARQRARATGSQRHSERAPKNASSANSVTCSPEIATRCVVPVALNTRH